MYRVQINLIENVNGLEVNTFLKEEFFTSQCEAEKYLQDKNFTFANNNICGQLWKSSTGEARVTEV